MNELSAVSSSENDKAYLDGELLAHGCVATRAGPLRVLRDDVAALEALGFLVVEMALHSC